MTGASLRLSVCLLVLACSVPDLELDGLPCPCADGWECDEEADVCVAVLASCEGADDGARCVDGTCREGECCTGCWDGAACLGGDDTAACGHRGAACESCACDGDTCAVGACTPVDPATGVGLGVDHTCAVLESGAVWCWGENGLGQLGLGDQVAHAGPEPVAPELDVEWSMVRASEYTTCALARDQSRWCWGENARGQLGLGDTEPRLEPDGSDELLSDLAAGSTHGCQVGATRGLTCWGGDEFGQLGVAGSTEDQPTPIETSAGGSWVRVAVDKHSCAIQVDKSLWCWGYGTDGELGLGDFQNGDVPERVGEREDWIEVSAGGFHTCGLTEGGALWCWGGDVFGQLGLGRLGPGNEEPEPAPVGEEMGWTRVAAGRSHTCGLRGGSELWCWGSNQQGEIGLDGEDSQAAPVRVGAAADWIDISLGGFHSCGLRRGGGIWCWGENTVGQVASGVPSPAPPTRVCL